MLTQFTCCKDTFSHKSKLPPVTKKTPDKSIRLNKFKQSIKLTNFDYIALAAYIAL